MIRLATALLVLAAGLQAAGPTADLARRLADAGLDPDSCYHVRDLSLARGDIRFYFNDGYLVFGKPVDGARVSAVFVANEEGGDAEVLLMPPTRSERLSLSTYAKSPNLNEHFRSAVLVFSDDTYAELEGRIRQSGEPRKSPERGILIAQEWDSVVRNFVQSFQVRLVRDLLGENREAFGAFYSAIGGVTLGNFDIIYDPRMPEQITVGQVVSREDHTYFNTWTRFASRAFRQGRITFDELQAVVTATLNESWRWESVRSLCRQGAACYPYHRSPGYATYVEALDSAPIPTAASELPDDSIRSEVIDAEAVTPAQAPNGASVLMPNHDRIKELLELIFWL